MNSPKKTLATRIKIAQKKKDIGWLEILTIIFDNDNTLLLTAVSIASSAIVCAITYLYQRAVLLNWEVPVELIGDVRNETVLYYISFGILYAIAIIINQIILRYVSLNTRIAWSIYGIVKRAIKAAKRHVIMASKSKKQQERSQAVLTKCKKRIGHTAKLVLAKEIVKEVCITSLSLIPACLIFQIASPSFSLASLTYVAPMVLFVAVVGGFLQSGFLMPQKVRELTEHSKHLKKSNKAEIFGIVKQTNEALAEWHKNKKASLRRSTLSRMWGTISRVDVYSAIIAIAMSSFLSIVLAITTPMQQKTFWLLEKVDQNQIYAAVYFKEDKAVFKEVVINNDTAFIQLHKQVYETCEDKNLTYREFDQTILDDGALDRLEQTILRK